MSTVKIRLARGGAKKKPCYSIVVARAAAPRDGDFIEKIGYYNPMLASSDPERVVMKLDRAAHWLNVGAQPTEKVAHLILAKGGSLTVKVQAKIDEKISKRSKRPSRKEAKGS